MALTGARRFTSIATRAAALVMTGVLVFVAHDVATPSEAGAPMEPGAAAVEADLAGRSQTPRAAAAPLVAAFGDSILRQLEILGPTHPGSSQALTRSIQDAGWRASVRGENGRPIRWIRRAAAVAADRDADGVIIVGGVNDVAWIHHHPHPRTARVQVAGQIRGLLDDLSRVDCVVWPTIPLGPNFFWGDRRPDVRSVLIVNTELRHQTTLRANLVVPEWGSSFDTHPGYAGPDGLHLSARGEAALQTTLLAAMHACLAPV